MSPLSQSSSLLPLFSQRQLRPSVNFNEYTYCGGTMESSLYRQSQEEAWGPCSSSSDLLWAQKCFCAVAEQAVKPKTVLLQPLSSTPMAATLTLKIFLLITFILELGQKLWTQLSPQDKKQLGRTGAEKVRKQNLRRIRDIAEW